MEPRRPPSPALRTVWWAARLNAVVIVLVTCFALGAAPCLEWLRSEPVTVTNVGQRPICDIRVSVHDGGFRTFERIEPRGRIATAIPRNRQEGGIVEIEYRDCERPSPTRACVSIYWTDDSSLDFEVSGERIVHDSHYRREQLRGCARE